MKKLVLIFLLLVPFTYGLCSDSDGGNVPGTFGYVNVDGVKYADACVSTISLTEYYCSGSSYSSGTNSCSYCQDGVCYQSSCSIANECNPVLKKWCDRSTWLDSGYCTDSNLGCYLKDSSCGSSVCTSGVCDYANYKSCSNNQWLTNDYCDFTICGNDANSLGYCFCISSETIESVCNDDKDNDCDGSVDCHDSDCSGKSGCECSGSETKSCSTDVGECVIGTQTCDSGTWGVCFGIEASSEKCDYLDNDCDGLIDEDCTCVVGETRDCGVDVGVCKAGIQICNLDNTWSICYGASYAASKIESCDGFDNDCDGLIDEGCECVLETTQVCGSIVGACKQGLQTCVNGSWSDCAGDIEAFPEICGDYVDNDCDGLIDSEDDVCNSSVLSIPVPEVECVFDYDCDVGYECDSNECVVEKVVSEVKEEVKSGTPSDLSGLSSGLPDDDSNDEEEGFDYGFLLISGIIVLLVVILLVVYFSSKKKPSKVINKKQKSNVSFTLKPVTEKILKSYVEKELEKSFSESKNLFQKK